MSLHQCTGIKNRLIFVGNRSKIFEDKSKFKYLGTTLKVKIAFTRKVINLWALVARWFRIFFFLSSATQKLKGWNVQSCNFTRCFVWLWNVAWHVNEGTQIESAWELTWWLCYITYTSLKLLQERIFASVTAGAVDKLWPVTQPTCHDIIWRAMFCSNKSWPLISLIHTK